MISLRDSSTTSDYQVDTTPSNIEPLGSEGSISSSSSSTDETVRVIDDDLILDDEVISLTTQSDSGEEVTDSNSTKSKMEGGSSAIEATSASMNEFTTSKDDITLSMTDVTDDVLESVNNANGTMPPGDVITFIDDVTMSVDSAIEVCLVEYCGAPMIVITGGEI